MSKSQEDILMEFITYNQPILDEIQAENNELSKAVSKVVAELFEKFVGVSVQPKEGKIEKPMNYYNVGDMVATLSGEYEGAGEVKKVTWSETEQTYIYTLKVKGIRKLFNELEENVYEVEPQELEETEYSNLTDKELKEKIEEAKEMLEMLDPEYEGDIGEIEKLKEEIDAYEMEIENRK